jgi:hypothetical protein
VACGVVRVVSRARAIDRSRTGGEGVNDRPPGN